MYQRKYNSTKCKKFVFDLLIAHVNTLKNCARNSMNDKGKSFYFFFVKSKNIKSH